MLLLADIQKSTFYGQWSEKFEVDNGNGISNKFDNEYDEVSVKLKIIVIYVN